MIFSGLILGLLLCHVNLLFVQHLVHHMLVFLSVPPIDVRNCKNIRNRFICCNSVHWSSSNVDRVSSSDSVTNISKSPKFTASNSRSVVSSTTSFGVVSHRSFHRKRKLCKSVISSSFVRSTNNDTSKKFIVCRDKINILTKPGNYYISSVVFLSSFIGIS